jgi:DNA replication protein DnaC
MSLQPERIAQLCELLKLPAIHAEWPAYAQRAAQEEHSFADFLESVLGAERAARTERVRQALMKLATLPAVKTLESYDFAFAAGDLPAFFGPSQAWRMANSGRVDEIAFLNSAGVRLPRLECGRTSL